MVRFQEGVRLADVDLQQEGIDICNIKLRNEAVGVIYRSKIPTQEATLSIHFGFHLYPDTTREARQFIQILDKSCAVVHIYTNTGLTHLADNSGVGRIYYKAFNTGSIFIS